MTIETPNTTRGMQKLATRRRLLDAALLVFARDGILAASTADIAREAGSSHGSLFAHFATQEELVEAVILDFGQTLMLRLHELNAGGGGVREVLAAHLQAVLEHESFYSALVAETALLPPRTRNCLIVIQSSICFHLAPAIEAETRAGGIRVLPLHLLFNTWIGLIHYYLANRELFAPGSSLIERRGSELLDHFMHLISKGDCES